MAADEKGPKIKPRFRVIVVNGQLRRIDLKAARERRKAAKAARAARGPQEDDRVAQVWRRADRKADAIIREGKAIDEVKRPRRAAARDINQREALGKASATPERVARAGEAQDVAAAGYQRFSDAPLDRLLAREVINQIQYDAGDKYREDFYRAGMETSGVIDPLRPNVGGGASGTAAGFMPTAEWQRAARVRIRAAEAQLGDELVPVIREILVESEPGADLAQIGRRMFGRAQAGEARAALIEVFKVALQKLAVHYGYAARGGHRRISGINYEKTA